MPGSRDTVLLALKSEEDSKTNKQTAFLTVYGENADGSWKVLMEEVEVPGAVKYEGVEVLSW